MLAMGWCNHFDHAALSGGSWLETEEFSLGHLKLRRQSLLARSANALTSSTTLDADFGRRVTLRLLGLHHHNLSRAATHAWEGSNTAPGVDNVFATGARPAWSLPFDGQLRTFERMNLWRNVAPALRGHYRYPVWAWLDDWYSVRYLRLRIVDTGNPAGAVYLGRPWASSAVLPARGASYGAQHGYTDKSSLAVAPGGGRQVDARRRFRNAQFALDWLSPGEAEIFHELLRSVGLCGEVAYLPDVRDMARCQRYGMLGRVNTLGKVGHGKVNFRGLGLRLDEL